jgi:O-antigen ligase
MIHEVAGEDVQKEIEIFLPLSLMAACGAIFFTLARPAVFLICAVGLAAVVATILFRDKLTYLFVFALALMPRYIGIALPGGIPDLSAIRLLILYYFGFSVLLNGKTILSNLKKMRRDAVNIAMLVLGATGFLVFLAHIDGWAFNAFFVFLFENIFVFYFVFLNIRSEKEVKGCFKALLLAACILCLFAIVESITRFNIFTHFGTLGNIGNLDMNGGLQRLGFTRVRASFGHPIALGCYILLIFPIAFNFFLNEKDKFKKAVLLGLSGLLLIALLLTLSRMPILCCALGLAMLFTVMNNRQKTMFLLVAGVVLALVVLCLSIRIIPDFIVDTLSSLFLTLTGGYVDNFGGNAFGFEDRLNLFTITGDVLRENPLLGGGLGYWETHKIYFFDYRRYAYGSYLVDAIDNDHLNNLMTGGIVGFGGYLSLYGVLLYKAFKSIKAKAGETLPIIAQAVWVSMFTYLLSLSSVDNMGTFKIFLVIAALFVAETREAGIANPTPPPLIPNKGG